jgi:hypothetical protein
MASGVVNNITTVMRTTKYGPKPVYNLVIDGTQYSNGFTKPPCEVGNTVSFDFTSGKYGNELLKGSLMAVATGGSTPPTSTPSPMPPSPPTRAYGPPVKPFPIPPLHGDRAIVRQNALTNARELYVACAPAGELTVSDFNAVADNIIQIARRFEAYSCGDLDFEAATREEKATPAKKSSTKTALEEAVA